MSHPLLALSDRETLELVPEGAVRRVDGTAQGLLALLPEARLAAPAGPDLMVFVHHSPEEDDASASLVWLPKGQVLVEFGEDVLKRPECLAVSQDGTRLAVSGRPERDDLESAPGQTHVFELPGGRCLDCVRHEAPFFVDLVQAGLVLGTARENGLMLWNTHVFHHPDSFPAVTFGGGRYLAALADSTRLTAWDVASGQQLWSRQVARARDSALTLAGHRQADRFVLLFPDGQMQVWGAGERPLAHGKLVHEREPYSPVALSPTGQILHYATREGLKSEGLPECYGC